MKSAFELLAAGGALEAVAKERERQDAKWGEQNHPMEWWLAILMEEVGELSEAMLETRFADGPHAQPNRGGVANIRKEALQAAAVLVAMVECLDRQEKQRLPVRYITASEERFRVEPLGNTSAVMFKCDPVEPEPVGTIVLMAFRVTGYDKDCDGSLMARLEHIDRKGEGTGWNPTHLGLYPSADLVVTPPEWAGMFDRSMALKKELHVISAACSEIGTRGETAIIQEAVNRIASKLYIDLNVMEGLT